MPVVQREILSPSGKRRAKVTTVTSEEKKPIRIPVRETVVITAAVLVLTCCAVFAEPVAREIAKYGATCICAAGISIALGLIFTKMDIKKGWEEWDSKHEK